MDYSEAFKRTLFEFDVTGAELSRTSGVSQQQISAFRKGKQGVSTDTLQKLLEALPAKARAHFYHLVQSPSGNELKTAENGPKYST